MNKESKHLTKILERVKLKSEETNIWLKRKRKRKRKSAVLAVKIEPKR